jgi:pyroglutamyl-peptidase
MGNVLVVGFGPFDGFDINPSQLLARELDGRTIAGRRVVGHVFQTATLTIERAIRTAFEEVQPDVIIATGLAHMRAGLSIERVAINFYEHDGPDAAGTVRSSGSLDADGPAARFATLPLDAIRDAWKAAGIPGYISNTAGTYCCNQVLYALLGCVAEAGSTALGGFIHLPCLPMQAAQMGSQTTPSMSLEAMIDGIVVAIEVSAPERAGAA